jgi:hypothetical protein
LQNFATQREEDMPTRPHTQSDGTEIVTQILEEAAKPRRTASVKKAFERKNHPTASPEKLDGGNGRKTRASKLPANRRSLKARKAGNPTGKAIGEKKASRRSHR